MYVGSTVAVQTNTSTPDRRQCVRVTWNVLTPALSASGVLSFSDWPYLRVPTHATPNTGTSCSVVVYTECASGGVTVKSEPASVGVRLAVTCVRQPPV